LFFDSSKPDPARSSPRSTTARIVRNRQRVCGSGAGEFCICSSP
jgi:hypothetical protein